MNERITELYIQARQLAKEAADKTKYDTHAEYQQSVTDKSYDTFAQLIVAECVGILETEIELVNGYKSTAHNDFDIRWHNGKIEHLTRLVQKSKKHFGV